MEYLKWSDNWCTVGHTSVHGWLSPADMEWFMSMHPEVRFTVTFYPPWGHSRARITPELMRSHFGDAPKGMYAAFPEDPAGRALLIALKLHGMQGERYMSKDAAWKVWRKKHGVND